MSRNVSKLSYAIYIFAHIFNSIFQNIFLKISSLRSINVTIYILLEITNIYFAQISNKSGLNSRHLQIPDRRADRIRRSAASAVRVATKAAADPTANRRGCALFSTRSSCTPSGLATPRIRARTPL